MKTVFFIASGDRCGKDTCASKLKERLESFDLKVDIYALGTKLKESACSLLGMSIEELDKCKNNNVNITYDNHEMSTRDFIKKVAGLVLSLMGDDYYINYVINKIVTSDSDVVIVPDLRFDNEYLRAAQKIDNVKFIKLNSDLSTCVAESISLRDDIDYDYVVNNEEGSLDTMALDIETIVAETVTNN